MQAGQRTRSARSEAENEVSKEANVSVANVKQSGRNCKVIRMKLDWNDMSEGNNMHALHASLAAEYIALDSQEAHLSLYPIEVSQLTNTFIAVTIDK